MPMGITSSLQTVSGSGSQASAKVPPIIYPMVQQSDLSTSSENYTGIPLETSTESTLQTSVLVLNSRQTPFSNVSLPVDSSSLVQTGAGGQAAANPLSQHSLSSTLSSRKNGSPT